VFQARPFSAGQDPAPSRAYPMQYYPLTSEAKSAQAVELTPGNEKSGIDFIMAPTAITQVHGVFAPGGADWQGGQLQVMLTSLAQHAGGMGAMVQKGTFQFRQVFPGSYILTAFSQGGEENRMGAFQRIDVSDKPVELALELKHAIDLNGKIEIEPSGNSNNNNKVTPSQINIALVPQYQVGIPGSQTQVSEDGTFTMKGVLPAPWRLQLNAPMGYVKAAWLGNQDVTNAPIDLLSGALGGLRILIGTNMGTIRGSAPAGTVILAERIDENTPFRRNFGITVDQNGQYNFSGLAPGKYRLVVMDSGGPMPDEGGQEITVREGETVMADLKAP